jgi:hypothetical protein
VPLGLLINFHEMKVTNGVGRLILPGATATLVPGAAPVNSTATTKSKPIIARLRASTNYPNYFTDGSGRAANPATRAKTAGAPMSSGSTLTARQERE